MTTLTKSEFARRQGWSPSYVTKLAQAGRLVLTDKGRVEVIASLAKIEATRDPRYDGQRDGHARKRDEKRAQERSAVPAVAWVSPPAEKAASDARGPAAGKKTSGEDPGMAAAATERRAKAVKMHFESRRAVIRVARLQGRLADLDLVRTLAGNDGATLRSLLENLADQAAPRLAPVRDPESVARILGDLLGDVTATMDKLLAKNLETMRQAAAEGQA